MRHLLSFLLLLSSLAGWAQTEVRTVDTTAASNANRLRIGAVAGRIGHKANTGDFVPAARLSELLSLSAVVETKQAALGFTPYNATNPSNYISRAGLSAASPLTYNSGTGSFGIPAASSGSSGFLVFTDWINFNAKQAALGYTPANVASNLSDLGSAATARTNLGLGTMATQSAGGVAITGGTISGLSALTLVGNLNLTGTSPQLQFGGSRFAHNFGTSNTFIGVGAGNTTLTGTTNVAIGVNAGGALSSGGSNVIVGSSGGVTTGSNNVIVGTGGVVAGTRSGNVAIGASSYINASATGNNVFAGNGAGGNSTGTYGNVVALGNDVLNGAGSLSNVFTVANSLRWLVGKHTDDGSTRLQIAGSISTPTVEKTAAYTLDATNHTVWANATAGALTLTLPGAAGISGRTYVIKKTDATANIVTISGTINGTSGYTLLAKDDYVQISSDGTGWQVVAATPKPTFLTPTITSSFTLTSWSTTTYTTVVPVNTLQQGRVYLVRAYYEQSGLDVVTQVWIVPIGGTYSGAANQPNLTENSSSYSGVARKFNLRVKPTNGVQGLEATVSTADMVGSGTVTFTVTPLF